MPCGGQIRGRHASPARRRRSPARLPVVPHADADLYGRHPRHDHSFRIPRPDISVRLGTPNACNDCHADKSAQWAADAIQSWHGPERKGFQHYAQAFHDAWAGDADAEALLAAVASDRSAPSFARASALAELQPYLSPSNVALASSGLTDPDPMA